MVQEQRSVEAWAGNIGEGWIGGWVAFAAIMMMSAAGMHRAFGVVAVLDDHWPGWTERNHAFLSVSAWGWVQIALAIVVFAAGIGVILALSKARIVGVIVAGLSLLDGFFIIPLYPWWAIIIIVIDVLVIWALTTQWPRASSGARSATG
jgi:hypothetical protein